MKREFNEHKAEMYALVPNSRGIVYASKHSLSNIGLGYWLLWKGNLYPARFYIFFNKGFIMQVIVIKRHQVDSWNGVSTFLTVAVDEDAAIRWIQDEVDHKHGSGHTYAEGKSALWWINYGTFSIDRIDVQE